MGLLFNRNIFIALHVFAGDSWWWWCWGYEREVKHELLRNSFYLLCTCVRTAPGGGGYAFDASKTEAHSYYYYYC